MAKEARRMDSVCCEPVGYVEREEPIPEEWPSGRDTVIEYNEEIMRKRARIRIREKYCDALKGLSPGSLVWVIWYAHRAPSGDEAPLTVKPFMDSSLPVTGVFATRSPARPCPLGLTLVYVEEVGDCSLAVRGLDAFHGTPVLDIKAYSEGLDSPREVLKRAKEAARPSRATS